MELHIPNFNLEPIKDHPRKEDVVGRPREFVEEFLLGVNHENLFRAMGTSPDKIYLLYGPPGTGKSFSIGAIYNSANEGLIKKIDEAAKKASDPNEKPLSESIKSSDLKILLLSYDIGKYGTAYINMTSRVIQEFFNRAFFYSSRGNVVVIELDEVDALIQRRASLRESEDKKGLETLMKNLQAAHDTPNVYVVMTSNVPELCDTAALRAGRLDRRILFDLPNYDEREHAFNYFIDQVNKRAKYSVIRRYDPKSLSAQSFNFSYADIANSVNHAVNLKVKEIIRREGKVIQPGHVCQVDLERSIKYVGREFVRIRAQKSKIGFG